MSQQADSAGVPWAGRSFESNPHAGDDGSADAALLRALEDVHAGKGDAVAVVEAYRSARLLIPLVAEAGDVGVAPSGLAVDKTQELSIVTVAAPDGRRVLPVFTSVATLAAWDPRARPVPVDGVRTALSAAADDTDLIVIDPTSSTEFVLRRPAVWAIGQGQRWEPAHRSPEVFSGLQASIGGEGVDVRRLRIGVAHASEGVDAMLVGHEGDDVAHVVRDDARFGLAVCHEKLLWLVRVLL